MSADRQPPDPQAPWRAWLARAEALDRRFDGQWRDGRYDHVQPLRLQHAVPSRLRRRYTVPVAWADWGPERGVPLVCVGGVANTARRFSFLAADLARAGQRVACLDWLGRGRSGWLADDREYGFETYVEQLRRFVEHLGVGPVPVLGSSMGGSVAIELAARHPRLVSGLILNDVGPLISRARRMRRSETLARHYVFRSPEDIMRRVGAAQKNDGPVGSDVRLYIAYHQTRWSPENGGRIYRHDPRAMLAYRRDAVHEVALWGSWAQVRVPVLVLHGMLSDVLTDAVIARMRASRPVTVAHIPATGHTPVLDDRNQTAIVLDWLAGRLHAPSEFCIPHAPPRRADGAAG